MMYYYSEIGTSEFKLSNAIFVGLREYVASFTGEKFNLSTLWITQYMKNNVLKSFFCGFREYVIAFVYGIIVIFVCFGSYVI